MTYIAQNFDTIMNIMYTTTQKQFTSSYWLFRCRSKSALVYPELYSVKVYRCINLCVAVNHNQ